MFLKNIMKYEVKWRHNTLAYFIAIYLQIAKVTVNEIETVWRICVKCIWNNRYTAQEYL